jgi:hypothetical protein
MFEMAEAHKACEEAPSRNLSLILPLVSHTVFLDEQQLAS